MKNNTSVKIYFSIYVTFLVIGVIGVLTYNGVRLIVFGEDLGWMKNNSFAMNVFYLLAINFLAMIFECSVLFFVIFIPFFLLLFR